MIRTEPELHWLVSGFLWVVFRAMVFSSLLGMVNPFESLIVLVAVLLFDFLGWLFRSTRTREKEQVLV